MTVVQFASFASLVQPTLWHELTRLKLEVLRLSDDRVPVTATYSVGKTIKDRNTGQEIELGCNISLGGEGFEKLRYVVKWPRRCVTGTNMEQLAGFHDRGTRDPEELQHVGGMEGL
jgi:hypothetical protein